MIENVEENELEDLDEMVIKLQGRSGWQYIDEKEKELDGLEQKRLDLIKQRKHNQIMAKRRDIADAQNREKVRIENQIQLKETSIKELMKCMNIVRHQDIIETYRELIENKMKIKDILVGYKNRVEEVEAEIQDLQKEYLQTKFEEHNSENRYNTPVYVMKIQSLLAEFERQAAKGDAGKEEPTEIIKMRERLLNYKKQKESKPAVEGTDQPVNDKENAQEEAEKTEFNTDAVAILEQKFSESFKFLLKKESEVKRMTNIINNSCTTISRILFQLEKNVKDIYSRKTEIVK